ncbi:MAG: hypothetical protein L0229_20300 [Blastocatellia bacterium]|nr:hypothetical protein [Blastocatellia bacterium]
MTLTLIKTENGSLLLEGSGPNGELEYYDLDGEGGEATKISFTPWGDNLVTVEGIETAEYDDDDNDSFWTALETVLSSARAAGVKLDDHAAY